MAPGASHRNGTSHRSRRTGRTLIDDAAHYHSDDDLPPSPATVDRPAITCWQPCEGHVTHTLDQSDLTARRLARLAQRRPPLKMHSRKPPMMSPGDAGTSQTRHIQSQEPEPNMTYGSITFGGGEGLIEEKSEGNHFACVSRDIEASRLCSLLYDGWELQRPSVILSITGADEDEAEPSQLPRVVENAYIEGITSIAGKTDAWIITGGFDCGAAGLTGKAVQAFRQVRSPHATDAMSSFACIGIAPLPIAKYHEKFLPPAYEKPAQKQPLPRSLPRWTLQGRGDSFVLTPAKRCVPSSSYPWCLVPSPTPRDFPQPP